MADSKIKVDLKEVLILLYNICISFDLVTILDNSTRQDYCDDEGCTDHLMTLPRELANEAKIEIHDWLKKRGLGFVDIGNAHRDKQ